MLMAEGLLPKTRAAVRRAVGRHSAGIDILMLLENNPYPQDVRVRAEAESLAGAGYRVQVIAPRDPGQLRREGVNGVDVRRFRGYEAIGDGPQRFFREFAVAAVALHLAASRGLLQGARVLHLHNPPDIFFPAGALFRLFGRKVIFDHHDLFPETVEAKFGAGLAAKLASFGERLTFAVANHVICTNESYAEIAKLRGRKSNENVTVVRNAPPKAWAELPVVVRDGSLSSIRLGYLGAMSTQDGVDALGAILEGVRRRGLAPSLTVVGDGDARPALEVQLSGAGLLDQATITGWVPLEDVPSLLEPADVCLDPAPATPVNDRSTMIKIAEYLALGKPVVAYDLLETRRTAADAAMLVPPGDVNGFVEAIIGLARDASLRERLAEAGRERAIELTWPHSERALLATYAYVLDTRRAGGTKRCR
jgi:glycosyltransferase involved in cell wall biosynthesis